MRSFALRYLTTAGLLAVLAVLLWHKDPLYIATGAYNTFIVLPQSIQLAIAGSFLVILWLIGGRLITNAIIMIAIVFFVPDIGFAWWRSALLDIADAIAKGDRHTAAMVYAKGSHYASVAAYLLVLLVALRLWVVVRRGVQRKRLKT
ncbi:hypothetical protein A2704_00380 [Candidatus Kaiserbacteria bacterium RIFCSPHIGHO2_01_FULL_54_36b]|uniref:Uncharacterized protein n=1 Tax=Candidatus Kaiserbacteria bacterium RIFCSPHIGHO2_01_FULL_54_36b TaxID=1798483 RepID=A0A1F6CRZ7_9BACT|nr:MAG: hypothetical protein A2704_00380 [Candidatus Kaiserbacteria bacterium RIFCSPHIGHO2_01_FULL_54_36b]